MEIKQKGKYPKEPPIRKYPELNKNQRIVLDWLKSRVEAGRQSFNVIKDMFKGFNAMLTPGEVSIALLELNEKERFQILEEFGKWGQKRDE